MSKYTTLNHQIIMHNEDGYLSGKDHHSVDCCCCCAVAAHIPCRPWGVILLLTLILRSVGHVYVTLICKHGAVFRHKFAKKFGTKNGPVLDTH